MAASGRLGPGGRPLRTPPWGRLRGRVSRGDSTGLDLRHIALGNLRRRKGKAILVVVGLSVAVAALVLVLSLVTSLRAAMNDKLTRYGANMVIMPTNPELSLNYGGIPVAGAGSGAVQYLGADVLEKVRAVPDAGHIVAAVPVALQRVSIQDRPVLAMGTDLAQTRTVKVWWKVEGAYPATADEVLLGLNVRNELGVDPGSVVRVGGADLRVSGILLETGGEEDGLIVMDQRTFATVTGGPAKINLVEVTVDSPAAVPALATQLGEVLPDATVSSVRQSLEFTNQANGSLTSFGLAITALIVVIAGLVVTITMLSAVKERQKEIGVFRAIGYRQRDVAKIVLYETAMLSAAAAVAGVGVGLIGGLSLPLLTTTLSLRFAFEPLVAVAGVALAFGLGMLAALYPARRAANMDPATALKYV